MRRSSNVPLSLLLAISSGIAALGCTASGGGGAGPIDAGADATFDATTSDAAPDARDDGGRFDIGDGSDDGPGCHLNDSFVPGTCDQCLEKFCCVEMNTCFGSADCMSLTDCAFACQSGGGDAGAPDAGGCTAACEAKYPAQVQNFRGWVGCLGYSCLQQCQ